MAKQKKWSNLFNWLFPIDRDTDLHDACTVCGGNCHECCLYGYSNHDYYHNRYMK